MQRRAAEIVGSLSDGELLPQGREASSQTAILVTHSAAATPHRTLTQLLRASVVRTTDDPRGTVHWVPPGEIVVYTVRERKLHTFVFRTPTTRLTQILTRVPGVSHPVTLLVQTTTRARLALVHRLLRQLERARLDPSQLPDGFYSKLHSVLARRAPSAAAIDSLLLQTHDLSAQCSERGGAGGKGRRRTGTLGNPSDATRMD